MSPLLPLTLAATTSALFPTGHITTTHSCSRSKGTSTSHSDSISYGEIQKEKNSNNPPEVMENSQLEDKASRFPLGLHSWVLQRQPTLPLTPRLSAKGAPLPPTNPHTRILLRVLLLLPSC